MGIWTVIRGPETSGSISISNWLSDDYASSNTSHSSTFEWHPACSLTRMKRNETTRFALIVTLVLGVFFAVTSGFVERVAFSENEGTFAHYCSAISGKLFTLGVLFLVIFAFELQRVKTLSRLKRVEDELATLRGATS